MTKKEKLKLIRFMIHVIHRYFILDFKKVVNKSFPSFLN